MTFFSPEVYTTNNKTNFKDPAYKVLGLGLATGQQGFTHPMTACLPACSDCAIFATASLAVLAS